MKRETNSLRLTWCFHYRILREKTIKTSILLIGFHQAGQELWPKQVFTCTHTLRHSRESSEGSLLDGIIEELKQNLRAVTFSLEAHRVSQTDLYRGRAQEFWMVYWSWRLSACVRSVMIIVSEKLWTLIDRVILEVKVLILINFCYDMWVWIN